jgi:hypothetical protein
MAKPTAMPIIRKMFNILRGRMSAQQVQTMSDYFSRTAKLRSGRGKRKKTKTSGI